jgi:hypothetical protein
VEIKKLRIELNEKIEKVMNFVLLKITSGDISLDKIDEIMLSKCVERASMEFFNYGDDRLLWDHAEFEAYLKQLNKGKGEN